MGYRTNVAGVSYWVDEEAEDIAALADSLEAATTQLDEADAKIAKLEADYDALHDQAAQMSRTIDAMSHEPCPHCGKIP